MEYTLKYLEITHIYNNDVSIIIKTPSSLLFYDTKYVIVILYICIYNI
jgi:hypothetical protein